MDVRLIVSSSGNIILTYLLKNNTISEIRVEYRNKPRLVGSIFKGRVRRVTKSLSGVFLDIGLDKEAYLPTKSILNGNEESCPIPSEGSDLIVQMKREPIDDKGAKVSCRISLAGKYMVYLPNTNKILFSSKLSGEDKKRLKAVFEPLVNGDGVIVRTSAKEATKEELETELGKLRSLWGNIKARARRKKPGILHEEKPTYVQLIMDHWHDIGEIVVDNREIWMELLSYLEEDLPNLLSKVRYVRNVSVFFKRYGLDSALGKIFSKYIWLKGGGFITIEETEAMTVIDVNSGTGCGDTLEENAVRTNLEAAEEIARQIKLRDIGGIVVIDFIDMKDRRNREKVIKRMRELFLEEGSRVHIYGITHLGLLEMTRKKETPSVTRLLSATCPYCRGRGYIKSPDILLYEIEKEISYFKGRYIDIKVNPAIKDELEDMIEKNNLKQWVSVQSTCDVPLDYYEMVLSG